jgi:hypothetical protein
VRPPAALYVRLVTGISKRGVGLAKQDAAAQTLNFVLAVGRVVDSAGPVGAPALAVLLALKAGPARPEDIGVSLACSSGTARQRLLRARQNRLTRNLIRSLPDGRYALTLKGHRLVNRVAGFAYHAVLPTLASRT